MLYRYLYGIVLLTLILSLIFPFNGQATALTMHQTQELDTSVIDAYVTGQMNELKIPGVAIGIVRGDKIEYVQGYGIADDSGRAMTPQTPFLVASFSKSITATGIMQLADEGKIDLDAPVQTYLPWFEVADAEYSSQITVRQLLSQTSGFSELEGDKRNLDTNFSDNALEDSIRELKDQSLSSPPGTKFEYSNTNYDVLGLIIQTVSGQSYESFIQENIFNPLEMTNSYTALPEARAANITSGYYPFFGFPLAWEDRMPYSRIITPSTGLFSSAEDMSRYLIAHLNQGKYQDVSIVSPEGVDELHTLAVKYSENAGYAMGWTVFPFPEADPNSEPPTTLAHGGRWIGYRSLMVIIPEKEAGVVIMMNKSDPSRESDMDNIGWSLALLALGVQPLDAPPVDFMTQYGRVVGLSVVLALGIFLTWQIKKFHFLSRHKITAQENKATRRQIVLLAVFDLLLAGTLLFVTVPGYNETIPLALKFRPDIGWLYVAILALTLGWGALRTILYAAASRG